MFSKDEMPPISIACQDTCGYGGGNLKYTNLDSIRDCRISKNAPARHRVRAPVAVVSGRGTEAGAFDEYLMPIRAKRQTITERPVISRRAQKRLAAKSADTLTAWGRGVRL